MVSRSSSGNSTVSSHRSPLTPKRSEAGGRPTRLRWSTAWIWFFSPVRSRTSWERRDIRRRARRVGSSASQTAGKKPVPSSRARVRASSWSVLALAAPMPLVTAALATTTRATWGSISRAMARALPVASSPT